MFDPDSYFAEIDRTLDRCSARFETPAKPHLRVEFDENAKWSIIVWRFEARFLTGSRLVAFESHSHWNHKHHRKLKYRFMNADGALIFQVDSHSQPIPFETPPHLHKGPTEDVRLQDGAWELDGLSLSGFDFCTMWRLIEDYLQYGRLPWRT